jgi:hypothetical protein
MMDVLLTYLDTLDNWFALRFGSIPKKINIKKKYAGIANVFSNYKKTFEHKLRKRCRLRYLTLYC